jgi:AGZA family xanthine/uracil permease-like MFS transporter
MKGIKGSLLIGIIFLRLIAITFGYVDRPAWISFDVDIRPIAFHLDIFGALKWGVLGSVFSLMFMSMFDGIGTLVACCYHAKMVDSHGKIKGLDRLLAIDALAGITGAIFGTSTTTAYVESAAGIEQGGRTGLTSVVTGILFLLAIIFAPLVGVVPEYATAPALLWWALYDEEEVAKLRYIEELSLIYYYRDDCAGYSISTGALALFRAYKVRRGQSKRGQADDVDYRYSVAGVFSRRQIRRLARVH